MQDLYGLINAHSTTCENSCLQGTLSISRNVYVNKKDTIVPLLKPFKVTTLSPLRPFVLDPKLEVQEEKVPNNSMLRPTLVSSIGCDSSYACIIIIETLMQDDLTKRPHLFCQNIYLTSKTLNDPFGHSQSLVTLRAR